RVCRIKACNLGCPRAATMFSLYCALKKATEEVTGRFDHRGRAMQETRSIIEAIAIDRKDFQHRLEDYNNSPATTFHDIQQVLQLLEDRFRKRLAAQSYSTR